MHRVEIGLSFDKFFFFTLGSQNYVRRLNLLGIGRLYRTDTEGKKSNRSKHQKNDRKPFPFLQKKYLKKIELFALHEKSTHRHQHTGTWP